MLNLFAAVAAGLTVSVVSPAAFGNARIAFPIPTAAPAATRTPHPAHGTIYVMADDAKAVYAFSDEAAGDVAPVVLAGPRTRLTGHAASIATDERGRLYVLDDAFAARGRTFAKQHILVFEPNAADDTPPARVLRLPDGFRAHQMSVCGGVVYLSTLSGAKPVHAFALRPGGSLAETASVGAAGSRFLSRLAFDGGRAFGSDYTHGIVAFASGPAGRLSQTAIPVPRAGGASHVDGVAAGGGLVDALSYGGLRYPSFVEELPSGAAVRTRPVRIVSLGDGSVHTPVPVGITADGRGTLYIVDVASPESPVAGEIAVVEAGSSTVTRVIAGSKIRWAGPVDIAHADSSR